ncbi:MAG: DMT family transporter [Anaerolineae bacterium]
MQDITGEIAALGTSLCFAFGSTLFTLAGREIGAQRVNRVRLLLAALLIALVHWLTFGRLLPAAASPDSVAWLAISGIVGLVLGDICLMQAFVLIGPRLSMLMMALAPMFSTVIAWLFLSEALDTQTVIGILLAVAGVILVVAGGARTVVHSSVAATGRAIRSGCCRARQLAGAGGRHGAVAARSCRGDGAAVGVADPPDG